MAGIIILIILEFSWLRAQLTLIFNTFKAIAVERGLYSIPSTFDDLYADVSSQEVAAGYGYTLVELT